MILLNSMNTPRCEARFGPSKIFQIQNNVTKRPPQTIEISALCG